MRYLIDTHVLIWFLEGYTIPQNVEATVKNENNNIYISIASIWEIAIKFNLGKLKIRKGFDSLRILLAEYDIEILSITIRHITPLLDLPRIHRDPFDRMIIAQAIAENLPIITKDRVFSSYPVEVIW